MGRRERILFFAAALGICVQGFAIPDFEEWINVVDASADWNVDANWSPGPHPNTNNSAAEFNQAPNTSPITITLTTPITIATIQYQYTSPYPYIITSSGPALTLSSNGGESLILVVDTTNTTPFAINCPVILANPLVINDAVFTTQPFVFGGGISESSPGQGIQTNHGTISLLGTSTYSGETLIGNDDDANTVVWQAGANNTFSSASAVRFANQTGFGSTQVLDLNNFNNEIANISGGTNTCGTVSLGSGTLTVGGNNNTSSYGGAITGTGGITKAGTGTITFAGNSVNYSGTTSVNAGALVYTGTSPTLGPATLVSGTTLDIASATTPTIASFAGTGNISLGTESLTLSGTSGSTTFSGTVSATSASITKTGGSTQTFSGPISYTGLTSLGGGTFALANTSSTLGQVTFTSSSAIFDVASATTPTVTAFSGNGQVNLGTTSLTLSGTSGSTTMSGTVSGTSASITKSGGSTQIFSGPVSYTGLTSLGGGTFGLAGTNDSIGQVTFASSSAIFDVASATTPSVTAISGNGQVNLGTANLTLSGTSGSTTLSGTISGTSAGITKSGGSTQIFSGPVSYTGLTSLGDGTFALAGTNASIGQVTFTGTSAIFDVASATTPTVTAFAGNGQVNLGGTSLTLSGTSGSTTMSGTVSGTSASITKSGGSTQIFSGPVSYTGLTSLGGGTFALAGTNESIGQVTFTSSSAIFDVASATTPSVTALSGNGQVNLGTTNLTLSGTSGSTTLSGTISGTSGGITKSGGSTQIFSGPVSYTGLTSLGGGTFALAGTNESIGQVTFTSSSAIFDVASATTPSVAALSGNGLINLGTTNLTLSGTSGNTTFSGTVSATSASITKTGGSTQTFSGPLSYTGLTSLGGGTFALANTNASLGQVTFTSSSAIFDVSSATTPTVTAFSGTGQVSLGTTSLTLSGTSGSTTLSGTISGTSASITKTGGSTQIFSGPVSYTGLTSLGGGTFALAGVNASIGQVTFTSSSAIFDVASATTPTVTALSGNGQVNLGTTNLTLSGTSGSTTLSGTISGTSAGITKSGGSTQIFSGPMSYTGVTSLGGGTFALANTSASLGQVTFTSSGAIFDITSATTPSITAFSGNGQVNLGGTSLTLSGTSGSTTLSGTISGTSSSITKSGGSTQIFSGPVSYTGLTSLGGGTFALAGTNDSIGQVTFTSSSAIFDVASATTPTVAALSGTGQVNLGTTNLTLSGTSGSTTLSGTISGTSASITKTGGSTQIFSGPVSYTGLTSLGGGTFALAGTNASIGQVTFTSSSAIFDVASATTPTVTAFSGNGQVNLGTTNLTLSGTSGSTTLSGTISGTSASLTKTGGSTQVFSGPVSFTGLATVNGGTISFTGSSPSIGGLAGASSTVSLGTDLHLTAPTGTTYSGTITGSGSLVLAGSGTQILSGTNDYTGGTTLSNGILQITNEANIGGSSAGATLDGGTLHTTSTMTSSGAFALTGNSTINTDVQTTLTGTLSDSAASGTLTLTLAGAGVNSLNTVNVANAPATMVISGVIGGSQTLTKTGPGTLTLPSANTYNAPTNINAGKVNLSTTNSTLGNASQLVTLQANTELDMAPGLTLPNPLSLAGTATFDVNTGSTALLSGTISGSGGLTKIGTGSLNLTGDNNYTGPTSVSAGTLAVNGSLTSDITVASGATLKGTGPNTGTLVVNGTMAPGNSIGVFTNIGDYTQSSGSTYSNEVSPVDSSQLVVTGAITIEPNATFALVPQAGSYVPHEFVVMTASGGVSGRFDHFTNTNAQVRGALFYTSNQVLLFLDFLRFSEQGFIGNPEKVALALDAIFDSGTNDMDFIIETLEPLSHDEQSQALNQMHPALYKGSAIVQENNSVLVRNAINNRFQYLLDTVHSSSRKKSTAPKQPTAFINRSAKLLVQAEPPAHALTFDILPEINAQPLSNYNSDAAEDHPQSNDSESPTAKSKAANTDQTQAKPASKLATEPSEATDDESSETPPPPPPEYQGGPTENPNGPDSYEMQTRFATIDAQPQSADGEEPTNGSQATPSSEAAAQPQAAGSEEANAESTATPNSNAAQPQAGDSEEPINELPATPSSETEAPDAAQAAGGEEPEEECCKAKDRPFHVWVEGLGDLLRQQNTTFAKSDQVGYKANTGGVIGGFDYHFLDHFYVGAIGAYTHSSVTWDQYSGHGGIDTGYAGLYFAAIGDLFYGNLSATGGWSDIDAHRNIIYPGVNRTATNDHNGVLLISHADTGLNFGYENFTFRPFDSLDFIVQKENGYTETGAGALNLTVNKANMNMLRNELGMNFAFCECFRKAKFDIDAKLSWVREVRMTGKGFTSVFQGGPGVPFSVIGYVPVRNLLAVGATLTGTLCNDRLTMTLFYNGQFGTKYQDNGFGGQLNFGF